MSVARHLPAFLTALLLGTSGFTLPARPVLAQAQTVSAAVGKPVQAAQSLLRQKKYRSALSQLAKADKVKGKSDYERYVIDQTRASVYQAMGRYDAAAQALEAVLASGRVSPGDRAERLQAIAQLWFAAEDYAQAADYGRRALKAGADDEVVRLLVARSDYRTGNHAQAAGMLTALVGTAEKAGRQPEPETLQLLAAARYQSGDAAGYADALRKTVRYDPSPENWSKAIQAAQAISPLPPDLALDLDRLKRATGVLAAASAYMAMAERALADGFAGEARAVLESGFESGVLGQGPEAGRHQRLLAFAREQAARQASRLPDQVHQADTGDELARLGLAYAGFGRYEDAVRLLEAALSARGLSDPDVALLRLGVVRIQGGRRDAAEKTLARVGDDSPAHELARLWLLTGTPES